MVHLFPCAATLRRQQCIGMTTPRTLGILTTIILATGRISLAQAPETISFQGALETSGSAVSDTLDIAFTLYDSTGTDVWTETHLDVSVLNGVFSIELGSVQPFEDLPFDHGYELGVKVGVDPEIAPRTDLTSVPYALSLRHLRVYPETAAHGPNLIGGSHGNAAFTSTHGVTISGGGRSGSGITILNNCTGHPGGRINFADGSWATIGGGYENYACAIGTVGGGSENTAAQGATVGGGSGNDASNFSATIAGGAVNTASGEYSSIPGGQLNVAAGAYSFAAGLRAEALHSGTFVWADSMFGGGGNFQSTGIQQFLIRARGGVGIGTNTPTGALDIEDAIEFQTDNLGGGQQNARIFFNEQSEIYGTSLAHIGRNDGTAVFDGTNFNLTANHFYILRHENDKAGEVALAVNRANGRTGVGRDNPQEMLHVKAPASTGIMVGGDGTAGPHGIIFDDDTGDAGVQLFWRTTNNHFVLEKSSAGTGTNGSDIFLYDRDDDTFGFASVVYPLASNTYTLGRSGNEWSEVWATNGVIQNSDRRLKREVAGLKYGLPEVLRMRPVSYRWTSSPDQGSKLGLIAQEVESVVPEVVEHGNDPESFLGMNYVELVPVLIKAIQDQQSLILEQRSAIEEHQEAIASLEGRLEAIEQVLVP